MEPPRDGRYGGRAMIPSPRFPGNDLPDLPHARQLKAGFPWLSFDHGLESAYREAVLDEHFPHIRVNLCLAIVVTTVVSLAEATALGRELNRIPALLHWAVVVPVLLLCLGASFSARRHSVYPLLSAGGAVLVGLSVAAIQIVTELAGTALMLPCMVLSAIFIYFMGGLVFYHALGANLLMILAFIAGAEVWQLPNRELGLDTLWIVVTNMFCASVAYMHEKTNRLRFLEAVLLREMVARDGLTGIQNRRMFDQHIQRAWQQAVRDSQRVAVVLVDIDCFKDYNDRYGHQAGDECLRAVAVSLTQCARRPMDFVARYGGEEFAVILYEANREYVAEVLTRIQRSIAELNIPHEASRVAGRLTVSIGAAYILPGSSRTPEGLIQLADEALYSAKEQGRNRVVLMESEYSGLKTGRFERHGGQRAR
jgi:diguanylate cyclase (GGDEF)-like protein